MLIFRIVALLHKRILSRIITPSAETTKIDVDLEQLLSLSSALAAAVDDMAASLWSPQDPRQIASRATTVQQRVHALREPLVTSGLLPSHTDNQSIEHKASSHIDSKDVEWFQMCFAQIDKAVNNTTNV